MKTLPRIKIEKIDFYVDLRGEEFRQVEDEENRISFDALHDRWNYLALFFDTRINNAYTGDWSGIYNDRFVTVFRLPLPADSKDEKFSRELPVVRIGDSNFFVDVRQKEFRHIETPANRITFNELDETPDGKFILFFDRKSRSIFRGSDQELSDRTDLIFITLPCPFELDPEGLNVLIQQVAKEKKERQAVSRASKNTPAKTDTATTKPKINPKI